MDRPKPKLFHLVLIKPSHYDDDGYVIQWARSVLPSNTLATLYGLALDCVEQCVLGEDIDILLSAYDETNTRIKVKDIVKQIQGSGGAGLVGLVGVQSNQFPRAMDIARQFRASGIQVCIGGFHVSGCFAMLPDTPPDLQEAIDLGISLFAGEAEGRLGTLLQDAYGEKLKPLYNYLNDLPAIEGMPGPYLPADRVTRTRGKTSSFDAGRGCPFLCSFCTIINVQGRKSRSRSADDVEQIVRRNLAQGIHSFFVTDDNFARNREWESLLDRLIHLRETEGIKVKMTIQVDTMSHKIRGFIEKARRAGVKKVFIGLENINPESLGGAGKGQNRITEYRAMLQAWQRVGVTTFVGYILGFPADTPETIVRDIKIIQRELPLDILEFFILTPLPGSADHKRLYEAGAPLDPDMNKYDLLHVTTPHPTMSKQTLQEMYEVAWDTYYTPAHVETVMRRAKTTGRGRPGTMGQKMLAFYACLKLEKTHPYEGGFFRRKYRRDRRSGMAHEDPLTFYSRYAWETVYKYSRALWMAWRYSRLAHRVDKETAEYTDLALTPVGLDEMGDLELFTVSSSARATLDKAQRKYAGKRVAVPEVIRE